MAKHYYAYLLRVWQVDDPDNVIWLSSLEDPHTRKTVGFRNLEQLFKYLQELTDNPPEAADPDGFPPVETQ